MAEAARRGAGDRGLTMTEMLVVMAISAVLAAAVVTFLGSFTERQREHEARSMGQVELDAAEEQLEADVALAAGVAVQPVADYPTTLALVDAGGALTRWSVAGGALVRTEQLGGATDTRTLVEAVVVSGSPFRYFGPTGAELVPAVDGADRLAYCATRVRVALAVTDDGGTRTFERDLVLPRRDPGDLSC